MEAATKIAEELYNQFYKAIPSRLLPVNKHEELAADLAIESARSTRGAVEKILDGMQSRTCSPESDPTYVFHLWLRVETELQIKKGGF
jgi:hypothetical protein